MKKLYYKCHLKSDLVLNESLATDGNISSLDYISGSVFMGIVANALYSTNSENLNIYRLIHSGDVIFGDALLSYENLLSYHVPYYFYKEKLNEDSPIYLQNELVERGIPKNEKEEEVPLVQMRNGYFNKDGYELKVAKVFSQKSARDSKTRKSADQQMFGFEAIKKGQNFIFPVIYKNEKDIKEVEKHLLGDKRAGKSKSSQYARITIEKCELSGTFDVKNTEDYALIYANSHLCILDELGQPKLNIEANDLGFKNAIIDWEKSQIRFYTYTSWNGKRRAPNTQRHCIARGSVFYIKQDKTPFKGNEMYFIGEYQNEGLGHLIINPSFLFKNGNNEFKFNKKSLQSEIRKEKKSYKESIIAQFLHDKRKRKESELELSESVIEAINRFKNQFKEISNSQWGIIRQVASSVNNIEDKCIIEMEIETKEALSKSKFGFITEGVAYEKQWSKNNLDEFKKLINNESYHFIAKFASEIVKNNQKAN